MRRLIALVVLGLGIVLGASSPALASCGNSNPNCIVPTPPYGTSNNLAASTAFVQAAVAGSGGGSLAIGGAVGGGTAGQFLYVGAGPVLAQIAPTGTGSPVLNSSPTLSGTIAGNLIWSGTQSFNSAITYGGVTLSNAVTGTGAMVLASAPTITNLVLAGTPSGAGSSITVNSTLCPLGGSCTIATGSITVGATLINSGISNGLLYTTGGALGNLATCDNGVIGTSGGGVPSCSSTLPASLAAASMTLTTPSLGVATATSINGLTISTSTGTLSIANSKTLTVSNSLTLAGTDSTTMTFPATSDTLAGLGTIQTFSAANTFSSTLNVTGTFEIGGTTVTLPISLANGGSNASLTASAGGVIYSTSSAFAILAGTVTAGQCLLSGSSAPPTWGSCTGSAAVSSVSNSDSTLTISPTTGAVVASLNLSHANTWAAAQTYTNGDFLLKGSSSGAMTLEAPAVASTYIMTFPAATDTVAVLGTAQTFTAVETFTNSDLRLLGSSTGYTTFTSANGSASNYALTFPAATSNVAVTSVVNQTFSATETFSSVLNVTGTFEAGGNAMTFPGGADTLAGLGTTQAFTATDTFSGTANFTGTFEGSAVATYLASPPAIGGTAPAAGYFTTLTLSGSIISKVRSSSAATVTASATTDYFFCLDPTSNAVTLDLPGSPATGLSYEVKDCTGQSATNNITVTPASGNIDGAATLVISTAYKSVGLTYSGSQWSIN